MGGAIVVVSAIGDMTAHYSACRERSRLNGPGAGVGKVGAKPARGVEFGRCIHKPSRRQHRHTHVVTSRYFTTRVRELASGGSPVAGCGIGQGEIVSSRL